MFCLDANDVFQKRSKLFALKSYERKEIVMEKWCWIPAVSWGTEGLTIVLMRKYTQYKETTATTISTEKTENISFGFFISSFAV